MMATKNVLVCDDDPVQLKILSSLINLAGYRTLAAMTPGEAMAKARICGVDAVVTDVVLPDGDGFTLVDGLRRLGFDAPIFMTSAHATAGMKERARRAGVKAFFEKPLPLRAIRDRVDAALQTSGLRDARVLVVENDPGLRAAIELIVGEAGFDVRTAGDDREAMELLASEDGRVDLLLMDPHVSGADLIAGALGRHPSMRAVMISDQAGRAEIRAGYEAGASALVRKSSRPERLQAFLKGTYQALVADRQRKDAERSRIARIAAEPWLRKAARRVKSFLHAPSRSRRGALRFGAVSAVLGLAVGAVFAWALQGAYEQADRLEAMAAHAMENPSVLPDLRALRQGELLGRLQNDEQLRLIREANAVTKNYYEAHLEQLRRQSTQKNATELAVPMIDVRSNPRR